MLTVPSCARGPTILLSPAKQNRPSMPRTAAGYAGPVPGRASARPGQCHAGPVPAACRACKLCRTSASSMQGQCHASAAGYACDGDVRAGVRARVGASCSFICSWLCQASAMPGQCHAGPVPCRARAEPVLCLLLYHLQLALELRRPVRLATCTDADPTTKAPPPGCGTHSTHTGALRACTQSQYSQYSRAGAEADRGRTTRA